MKILLGGVPFGCDNIGDEAILASVISIFRRLVPDAEITVLTRAISETSKKFNLPCVPLFGFHLGPPLEEFEHEVKKYDFYVWAGATGLSDYPKLACKLLEIAQKNSVKTIVWNVGMNSSLNPAFFKIGRCKSAICSVVSRILPIDLKKTWEDYRERKMRKHIGAVLNKCDLVVLRDIQSWNEVKKCNPEVNAFVGADSAILQQSVDVLNWSEEDKQKFYSKPKRIALCISAQTPVRQMTEFVSFIDHESKKNPDILWVMVPMNPISDYKLLKSMQEKAACKENILLTRFIEPEEIQTLVGECHFTISSRLHLIILSLNKAIPAIGIGRGSKVNNFLSYFHLPLCGTTDSIDFDAMAKNIEKYLNDNTFSAFAQEKQKEMLSSLSEAEKKLTALLLSSK